MRKFFILLSALLTANLFLTNPAALAQEADGFKHVKGNVYYYKSGNYNSLFLKNPEGIVVVDPNGNAAARLKKDLVKMTDRPVTHLIYSHFHADHASGGDVFGSASVIAHASAPQSIDGVTPDIRFDKKHRFTVGDNDFELVHLGAGHGVGMIATIVRPENVIFIVDIAAPERMFFRDFPRSDLDGWYEQIKNAEKLKYFCPRPWQSWHA
jgi:glyoxylase-like metal-dependent hydrolase (beta-lactamase superfamily II)